MQVMFWANTGLLVKLGPANLFNQNMNFFPFPVLHSGRLMLRQLVGKDRDAMFFLRSDENLNRYTGIVRPLIPEAAMEFIRNINEGISEGKWIYWAISMKPGTALIGTICLWNFNAAGTEAETGFVLHPELQGKGLMTEALERVLDYGFNDLGLKKILARTHFENERSIKLLHRAGFNRRPDLDTPEDTEEWFFIKENG